MTCTETLKESLTTFQQEAKINETLMNSLMDKYLDQLIEIQNLLKKQSSNIENLCANLIKTIPYINSAELSIFHDLLSLIILDLSKSFSQIKNRKDLYQGVKTDLLIYRDSIDDLKEVFSDLKTISKLKDDEGYKYLIKTYTLL